jgi:enterochelin esterase-like enzyme
MRKLILLALFLSAIAWSAPLFEVTFPSSIRDTAVDGRVIVVVSKQLKGEPRFQVSWGVRTQQVFGIDVDGWQPGQAVTVDDSADGHPLTGPAELEAGTYRVQAVLHLYETFHRSDGHVVKLPMDNGEGQHWNRSPGNLCSEPKEVKIGADSKISIQLSKLIPPIEPPKDTKYIRHIKIQSKLLTEFWGRPMHLGAIVLVPEGFDAETDQRYPVMFRQGHFPSAMRGFREEPPGDSLKGNALRRARSAHRFYQEWTSGRLPKMLLVLTQHATPYYDDSYGVNTANMGPYGDALTQELYPHIEKEFRGIGEPWARVLYGGSTGGWMSLAQQIFYPDYFGGTWSFCPDPVDFHAFQLIDVYKDKNAFFDIGPFSKNDKPMGRRTNGSILFTVRDFSRQERALGTHGRSGGQADAFHATFGPVGEDGYPSLLWDPDTGEIDSFVAKYWQENFDLNAILKRDWKTLGPKLVGKIHVTMGTKDTFYLDTATVMMEKFLETTKEPGKGPYYGGSFEYGPDQPHCYVGEIPPGKNTEMHYMPIFADHMKMMAPENADTSSWRP